ncbi:uncharacterized protein ACWYII_025741 isoform 2-T2 [Salvelinus alpinus]
MQNVLKKKRRKITASEQEQEEPAIKEDQVDGHQLTGEKRNKELPGHKKQTVTELEMVEKERKNRKKQKKKEKQIDVQAEMEVPDPEEQTEGKTSNKLQTRRVRDEAMSSWKKRKNYNDSETKEGMDSGLSASAVDVSDVRVPVEARKSKKKHKNRQTKLEEGAESRQTVLRFADDPEIIELYIEAVEGGENVVTEVQKKVKEKRKRKKEIVGEIQLNVCPDETELPGILEQTGRKWKTTRLKTQPDGGAVEGSRRRKIQPDGGAVEGSRRRKIQPDGGAVEGSRRRKIQPDGGAVEGSRRRKIQPDGGAVEGSRRRKRRRCRESDTGMDSVPSMSEITDLTASNDNGTHDSGPEPEKDGPHTTMVETSAQQRRRCLKVKPLSEKEWRAMNELKEFVPNIASWSVLRIRVMIKYDLDRFKEFRRQAEGIPRPWHRIYSRGGRKMFDGSSYKGRRRFSQDELASLKKLQMLYGNKWVKISQLTGRSEVPLMRRFSQMYANLGSWSEEELKRLMEAVRDHLLGKVEPGSGPATIRKDKLYNNIPWTDICRRVKTRHRVQCRMKWLGFVAHKMAFGQPAFSGGVKTLKAKVDLIKALNTMQVEDAVYVDWEEIANTIGCVTPCYVQMHYHWLKVSKVPLWQSMSFCEIIDFLYSSVLPQFEELLRHSQTESGETESRDDRREHFLLSEIFENEDD